MVSIARHTDYATRIVLHLAGLEHGTLVPIAQIAARRLLPTPFVRRVVGTLAKAAILETVRGAHGGVRLARPAATITLLDVVRAMEGGVALNRCLETHELCPFAANCPVHDAWAGATAALEAELESIQFAALAGRLREPRALRQLRPSGPKLAVATAAKSMHDGAPSARRRLPPHAPKPGTKGLPVPARPDGEPHGS